MFRFHRGTRVFCPASFSTSPWTSLTRQQDIGPNRECSRSLRRRGSIGSAWFSASRVDTLTAWKSELSVGKEVWLKLPYGDFVIGEESVSAGPIVLLAGGTGVAPYVPFLVSQRQAGNIHLYYGARQPEHLLFVPEFTRLRAESWFHLHLFLEQGALPSLGSQAGRLSIAGVAADLGADFLAAQYYLSGPPQMIASFQRELMQRGVGAASIHQDEWE
uniref:SpaV n=1 Tax=Spirochaeta aurantia TaxID=147 RepID=Q0PHY4_SPIAU|nr:SpaV [Spirochaeta aurantia]